MPLIVPAAIHSLATACHDAGGHAYVVGGCVRDHHMGLPIKDWDIEVFGVEPRELVRTLRRWGSVNEVGRSFGVYKWRPRGAPADDSEIDVSIPRRDSKVGPGHRGIEVQGDPDMPPIEAARRRDLTINALMWSITDASLFDPWGGLADLEAHRLRAVDTDTFLEDPLRALRVVQFAARLGFDPDTTLIGLCREAALDELPAERVQGEWHKLLLKGRTIAHGFDVARRANVLQRVFPEAAGLNADRYLDALASDRAQVDGDGRRWTLMLAAWLHQATVEQVDATLDRLWLHKVGGYPTRRRTHEVVQHWNDRVDSDAALRWLSTRCEVQLALAVRAAVVGEDMASPQAAAARLGIQVAKPEPLLTGRDLKSLGIAPGPHMGTLLEAVYAQQLDGAITTAAEANMAALRLS